MKVFCVKISGILLNIFLCNFCIAQVVKTPFPINKLSWSHNNEAFSFSEGNNIFLRDSKTYELLNTINIKNISNFTFSREGEKQVLLAISKDGFFFVYNLELKDGKLTLTSQQPYFSINMSNRRNISQVAFSENSDYIALAMEDNSINLFFKLRISKQAFSKKLSGHWSSIYNLGFSKDSKYLVSTSSDGTAMVWDCGNSNQKLILRNIYTENQVPALFLNNSNIICCDSESSFAVYNLNGEKQLSINTLNKIRMIKPMLTGRYVSILTDENEIQIYDISNNKWIGYIPKCSASMVTDYQFNKDCTYILIGTQDGCIYKYVLAEVLLHPNEKPKKIIKETSELNKIQTARPVIEGRNSLVLSAGTSYLQSPFLFSLNLDAQFRYRKKLEPFFLGIGLEGQLGFSKDSEIQNYRLNGEKFNNLNIITGTLYVPMGIQFFPGNRNFYFIFVCKGGVRITELALLSKSRYIIGDYETTYYVSGGTGFGYRFFETTVNLEYDGIGKLNPSIYAGLNFKMG